MQKLSGCDAHRSTLWRSRTADDASSGSCPGPEWKVTRRSMATPKASPPDEHIEVAKLFEHIEWPLPPPPELDPIPVKRDMDDSPILQPKEGVLTSLVKYFLNHPAQGAGAASRLLSICDYSACVDALKTLLLHVNKDKSRAGMSADDYAKLIDTLEGTTAWAATQRNLTALHPLIKVCDVRQKEVVFANLLLTQLVDFSDVMASLPDPDEKSRTSFRAVCEAAVKMAKNNVEPHSRLLCLARRSNELDRATLRGHFVDKHLKAFKGLIRKTCNALLLLETITKNEADKIMDVLLPGEELEEWDSQLDADDLPLLSEDS